MKNIYKTLSICLPLGLTMLITGCDSNFEEINTDPDKPTEISADLQLGFIERSLVNEVYDYFVSGECAATWPQHISKPIYNDADRYYPRLGAINTFWNTMYVNVIAEADEMYKLGGEAENPAIQGAALTLKAMALQYLTDSFGDIPMSEANAGLSDGNFTPAYDSQEAVYQGIFSMLDEAIAKFATGEGALSSSQDLMYGGDLDKWLKFATSVKFRALMRISDTSLFNSSEVQSLISSGNLITSNDDNAFIAFETENAPNANPYYGIVQNGRQAEWCMGEALVEFMKGQSDPRLAVYAKENANGEYVGKPAGYINPGISGFGAGVVSEIGDAYMAADAPLFLMTAAQVNLLIAEAIERFGASGDAATYFQAGIDASLEQNGLDAGSFTPSYNGYQSIAEQLWASTFLQGYETWSEWRRSDIPANLSLAIDPQPGVNSIPTRYGYTNDEKSLNADNVAGAVANQGEDALTTKLWWDVK
ncbi:MULTISPECIES: SusD/RagB family nutrient-binding outer membrane lipoprotein [Flavobacteriaceae]|uniref:SusD/RagB family nutrient-binding outer membrane lipoprotein n=1 Tax=Croceivirga radicis TaxID=1929488 RepID=A0A1V6LPT7_9FLAO|nr:MULTISPECIES: SusD/RagB family nutrient-binding outer membrane lipoprotein [Flavobacteriaceae]OQD41986.1 hypothetical protein BUL40_12795 [Croceivirga radicis]TKD61391.1 SusD/RagB family nutrient-binding outer membrane lipoprotein [Flavobacterium sp. ASW18X]